MLLSRRGFLTTTALTGGAALLPGELRAADTVPAGAASLQSWDAVRELFALDPQYVHADARRRCSPRRARTTRPTCGCRSASRTRRPTSRRPWPPCERWD